MESWTRLANDTSMMKIMNEASTTERSSFAKLGREVA